ncbi:MAG: phospholipase [Deltaproteobacteria bacterium]|nr:phospholipase [Deltaproteobacteria bacterium]
MTAILVPGLTCGRMLAAPPSGVLVDVRSFYASLYDAFERAERSILMLGWQFESKVALLHGADAEGRTHPIQLVELLRALCEERPHLHVHILAWDASAVFAFERVPLQRLMFTVRGHTRVHYRQDRQHPFGASHHQKLVVVDRSIAFVGGMDVCNSRWDDRTHHAHDPERRSHGMRYGPYHDVHAFVTGDPVDVLRGWFRDRWRRATGDELPGDDGLPRRRIPIRPTLDLSARCIGLARTWPRIEERPRLQRAPLSELAELHIRAIALAERVIYLENQYLSSWAIAEALVRRMRRAVPRLEIVLVLPKQSRGFKERISIGVYQARILDRLGRVAAETGHRLGVYYTVSPGEHGDVPVFIHGKVLAVDDRFVLVSSANLSNRSMGFDSELGVAWESPEPQASLRAVRTSLLAEHAGVAPSVVEPLEGLVGRLDDLARSRAHRLRLHGRNRDELPGRILSRLLPDGDTPLDPREPRVMEEALPEPVAYLDRAFRDPLLVLVRAVRGLTLRMRRRFA